MPVIMCTQGLWKRLGRKDKLESAATVVDSGPGRLGNWSAKLVTLFRRPHVIFANQKTLMCVLMPMAPGRTLFARFATRVGELLVEIGVDPALADQESVALFEATFGKSSDRSLLGSLNDLADMAESMAPWFMPEADEGVYPTLHEELNETLHVNRKPVFAVDAVRDLYGLPLTRSADELPELIARAVAKKLEQSFVARVPAAARDQVRLGHRIEGSIVSLTESRAPWKGTGDWTTRDVAKFQYDSTSNRWRLYCVDREGVMRRYPLAPQTPSIDELIEHVARDSAGAFWG